MNGDKSNAETERYEAKRYN